MNCRASRRCSPTRGLDAPPKARTAVLVGQRSRPGSPHEKPDGTKVHTLWGELAWQLGGAEGYALVADADRTGTNPGDALIELLRAVRAVPDPDRRVGRLRPPALRRRRAPGGIVRRPVHVRAGADRGGAGSAKARCSSSRSRRRTSRSAARAAGRRSSG